MAAYGRTASSWETRSAAGLRSAVPAKVARRRSMVVVGAFLTVLLGGCGQDSSSGNAADSSSTAPASRSPSSEAETHENAPAPSATSRPRSAHLPQDLADITRVAVVHRQNSVLLRVALADTSTLWPCAMPTGDYFEIHLDTDEDPQRDRAVWIPWQCGSVGVTRHLEDGAKPYCRVPQPNLDSSGRRFALRLPTACLASPTRLRAYAFVLSDHMRRSSVIPTDQTAWTPFAAVGEAASIADPAGDTGRRRGA